MDAPKSGIVFIDVGWHRRTGELFGLPTTEPEVAACWNVEDEANPKHPIVSAGFDDVDEAIEWARQRAPLILIRLGATEDLVYSAGERLATREQPEFGGTDLTPYAEWPPSDWFGYETPEEAARGDIPGHLARVVWSERRGDRAVVLLQVSTNPPYFDVSHCGRGPRGWVAESSGGASGSERPEDFESWLAEGNFED